MLQCHEEAHNCALENTSNRVRCDNWLKDVSP